MRIPVGDILQHLRWNAPLASWRAVIIAACAALTIPGAEAAVVDWRHEAVSAALRVCASGLGAPPTEGASFAGEERFGRSDENNRRQTWTTTNGAIEVTATTRTGMPLLFFVALHDGAAEERPVIRLVVDQQCRIRGGEEIVYADAASGRAIEMRLLNPKLALRAPPIPFNPPVPSRLGTNRECTFVAVLDNGVNYLIPQLSERLARNADGALVGYDFWEDDALPFDFGLPESVRNPFLSPFAPPQHGTSVASVLVEEAPETVCPTPYRYYPGDRDEMMGEIIDRIAADGNRIVVIATGRPNPWPSFADAMADHPELLFIAASGNDGVDLTKRPFYPMSYSAPNLLVVGANNADGAAWPRSNRGRGLVQLSVPAVELAGFDFNGAPKLLSGTSFASPRVGALAGMISSVRPELDGAALRAYIMMLARKITGMPDRNTDTLVLTESAIQEMFDAQSGFSD